MNVKTAALPVLLAGLMVSAADLQAACVNRFVSRTESRMQVVTLLTGKLTFQEAQHVSAEISAGRMPPLEWIGESGKTIAKQIGVLKVVRPMPVGCDGRTSGVIVIASFPAAIPPSKKMTVKLTPESTVEFEQQAQ